ncbi:MAG: hypothetical protein RR255_00360 [Bacilli bacterium]
MATVLFKRKTAAEVASLPVEDGSVIFNTTDKSILMDNGTQRERYAGGNLSTTDIVNTLAEAITVTSPTVPVGCGVIKSLNTDLTNKPNIIYETVRATLTGDYCFVRKEGYALLAAYVIRNDSGFFVKGIQKQSADWLYTILIENGKGGDIALYLIWTK